MIRQQQHMSTIDDDDNGLAGSLFADTPPGVLTKIDMVLHQPVDDLPTTHCRVVPINMIGVQRSTSTQKHICSVCLRRAFCLCAQCAANNCKFYEKRTMQTRLECDKRRHSCRIESALMADWRLLDELHALTRDVSLLRTACQLRRRSIDRLRRDSVHTRALIARSQRIADQLRDKETNNRHTLATVFDQRSQLLVEHRRQLDKFERDLDVQRQKLACALFTVFPIAKIQRRSTDSVAPSMARNNVNQALAEATATQFVDGRWVFIDGDELFDKVSHYFTLVDCRIPDDSKYDLLKQRLIANNTTSISSTTVSATAVTTSTSDSIGTQSMLAALGYAIQLINLLTIVYDTVLPYKISIRDMQMTSTWTAALFDTDITKLNACVQLVCIARGVPSHQIDIQRPFANLRRLYRLLTTKGDHQNCERMVLTPTMVPPSPSVWEERQSPDYQRQHSGIIDDWEQVSGDEYVTGATVSPQQQLSLFTSVTSFFRETK